MTAFVRVLTTRSILFISLLTFQSSANFLSPMSRFLRVKNHSLNASGYSGDNDNLHGSLRTRIISSRVGKHTADFLERKFSAVASKYLKGPCKQARPEIIIQQLLHDSSDTASTYSGSTITTWRGSLNTEDAARILPTISPNEVQYQELMFELMVTEEGYFTDLRNLMEVKREAYKFFWDIWASCLTR